jgi:hypothetical protein
MDIQKNWKSPQDHNHEATNKSNGMVNLTKMWRACGEDPANAPLLWLNFEGNAEYIRLVKEKNAHQDCIKSKAGDVYAHPLIGLKYAEDLSPEFRVWSLSKSVEILNSVTPAQ